MTIRPEFKQFISSGSWGKQRGFYEPSSDEVQANAFQLPVDSSMTGSFRRMHLDLLNIGHNVQGFNSLPEATRTEAEAIANRGGTYGEVQALEKGDLAACHMSNVASAQRSLIGSVLGPGFGALQAMEALAPHVSRAQGGQVNIGVGQFSSECIAADVYPVSDVSYMGQSMKGITQDPIGRVYIDLTNGTAFMLPDDVFDGKR